MIPLTINPMTSEKRFRETTYGLEAEMTVDEAADYLESPGEEWWELNTKASALYLTGRTKEALEVCKRALALKSVTPTLVNMSIILETMGKFDAALLYAKEAYETSGEDTRSHALYGEALLRMGNMREGWSLYVKHRAQHGWLVPFLKEWKGQDLNGKKLLVLEGGGYGDNIYFLRWLDTLRSEGAIIDYICQPDFAPLVRHLGYTAIENWQGNVDVAFESYDYFTSVLALPHKLGVTFENYHATAYIPFKKKFHWGKRIGLCWRAGEGKSPRKQRSISQEMMELIVPHIPGTLVNLTMGQDLPVRKPKIDNWMDTVNLVASCDLVISVDTGVAHLAGAMGVPVWVMLPGASAWQYPAYRDDHPFYPSMRMLRNGEEGLAHAVNKAITELRNM